MIEDGAEALYLHKVVIVSFVIELSHLIDFAFIPDLHFARAPIRHSHLVYFCQRGFMLGASICSYADLFYCAIFAHLVMNVRPAALTRLGEMSDMLRCSMQKCLSSSTVLVPFRALSRLSFFQLIHLVADTIECHLCSQ